MATVAIGDRCTRPNDYAPAFRAGRDAVELMIRLGRPDAVVETDGLGPYGLLLRASSRSDLETFAQRTLGPLLDHDRRHDGELVATLRAYLETGGVQRQVAARRFIHVNTVVYRLRRIRELLDLDVADPAAVFDLTLAFRVMDLIGLGEPASVGTAPAPSRLRG